MIQFIVVSSFFLQDYISFIFLLDFFFVVFSFGVVVFLLLITIAWLSLLEFLPFHSGANIRVLLKCKDNSCQATGEPACESEA